MDDPCLRTHGGGDLPGDLVPGQDLVRHDVEGVADRLAATQQAHEALGEIAVVGDRPQRRAVAGHDERLPLAHPRDRREGPFPAVHGQWHLRVAVGERRADDRDREPVLAVRPHQALLASDLVPRVVPERVGERRIFANELGIDFVALECELEHGLRDPETDVTGNDSIITAKIALAHLKEFPDYYTRLAVLEREAADHWSTRK